MTSVPVASSIYVDPKLEKQFEEVMYQTNIPMFCLYKSMKIYWFVKVTEQLEITNMELSFVNDQIYDNCWLIDVGKLTFTTLQGGFGY